jgi:hypothetical protein
MQMDGRRPQVLLAGETASDAMALADNLGRSGCDLHVATTFEEACALLTERPFDLVLSDIRLADGSAYPLVTMLVGSNATLYFFQPVREGCWWLPAVLRGEYRWGAPALRPTEFARTLERILEELTSARIPASVAPGARRGSAPASVMAPASPRAFPTPSRREPRRERPVAQAGKGKSA